jgi:hypothetical protein
MRSIGVLLVGALLLNGCAEYAEFYSDPPGAQVYLNDKLIGQTPIEEYRIPRSEVDRPRNYRIELTGYEPAKGELKPSVAAGRIVAAVFTMCITCAFHGFHYFKPLDVALTKDAATVAGTTRGTPAERLRQLEEARDKGLINEHEYERLRGQILSEF